MASQCPEYHLFSALGRKMAFHVPSMLYYVLSDAANVLLSEAGRAGPAAARRKTAWRHGPRAAREAYSALSAAGFFDGAAAPKVAPETLRPLSTLELCVTHACNLACRYCYGSRDHESCKQDGGLLYGAQEAQMPETVAQAGIDLLLARSGRLKTVNVSFFGGEPFLNFPLIQAATLYAEAQALARGKAVRFSAVTNGTPLTPEMIDFVKAHHIQVQVSMDGPAAVHDANRPFRAGAGSYESVCRGSALLKTAQRHPTARATAAHGNLDAPAVLAHLQSLGFGSVHVEPALWNSGAGTMNDEDVAALMRQEEEIAARIVAGIDAGEVHEYHALTRLIRETRVIKERRRYFCGAGRGLLCLSAEGKFYPCHRFAGQEPFCLGTLQTGLDDRKRQPFRLLHVDARPGCRECWARYLCGGGCWDHANSAHGELAMPDETKSCRIMRRRLELAMAVNAILKESRAPEAAAGQGTAAQPVIAQ